MYIKKYGNNKVETKTIREILCVHCCVKIKLLDKTIARQSGEFQHGLKSTAETSYTCTTKHIYVYIYTTQQQQSVRKQ